MRFISKLRQAWGAQNYRIALLLTCIAAANVVCLALNWSAFHRFGFLFSTGLLAYGFGLRHAVDADHISAIDNTTRKLMQAGKRPIGVGFFFSLGHSTVVILLCAALALSSAYVQHHLHQWQSIGGFAGTLIFGWAGSHRCARHSPMRAASPNRMGS